MPRLPLEHARAPGYASDAVLHSIVLFLHSGLRWLVLILAFVVVLRSLAGWRATRSWSSTDDRLHAGFVWSVRVQFILGALLYLLLSPITKAFFANLRVAMKVSELRFFGLEHVVMMVLAVAIADSGRARSKRIADPQRRRRRVFVVSGIPLLLMLAAIPWPYTPTWRPLLRGIPHTTPFATRAGSCPPSYASRCAACHGDHGLGDGPLASGLNPPPRGFDDAAWQKSQSPAKLRRVIREGGPALGLSPLMPAHADLNDAELDALVTCVVSLGRTQ
jgi:hypothetical protein